MVSSAVLSNKANIAIRNFSDVVLAPAKGNGTNFFLAARPIDIANYSRQGNDLAVEFTNGQQLLIRDFFVGGDGYNNLVLSNDATLQLVDFSSSLTATGDGITEVLVAYEIISDSASVSSLLGLLGTAAAGFGALAAGALGSTSSGNEILSGGG